MNESVDKPQRQTLQGVQVIRGLAATMVLLFHVASKQAGDYQTQLPGLAPFIEFGFAGVDLFFVLSGFIIVWITWPDIGRPSGVPRFLVRRFLRVVPIFWLVWLASGLIYFALGVEFFRCKPTGIFEQTASSLFLINPSAHCVVPQAWTLSWELMFYGVFALFLCFPRVLLPFFLAAWAGLIAAAITMGFSLRMPLEAYCLHFILGCIVGMLTRTAPIPVPSLTIVLGLVLWAGSIWAIFTGAAAATNALMRFALFGIPSAVLLYGVASADVRSNARYPAPLQLLGDASYVLYLIHITVLFYMHLTFPKIDSMWGHWIWAGAAIFGSIGAAFLLHIFVERPMLRGLNKMKLKVIIPVIAVASVALLGLAWFLQSSFTPAGPASAAVPAATAEAPAEPVIPALDAITVIDGVQGWATILVEGDQLDVPGWAVDRERDQTVKNVLVFIDGELVAQQEPTLPRPDVPVAKTEGNLQPGFRLYLDAAKVAAAKCVRFVAVMDGGRFGHIGVQVRGEGDETELCWDPTVRPA